MSIKTVKVLRNTGLKKECANGHKRNLGNHQPGTLWAEMDYMFATFCGRNINKTFELKQFQDIYAGLIQACGFKDGYGKKMASESHLRNGPVYAGFIEIIETDERLDDYAKKILDYCSDDNHFKSYIDSKIPMKEIGIDPFEGPHRGWRTFKAIKLLEDLGYLEVFKMDPSVRTSPVLIRAIKKAA